MQNMLGEAISICANIFSNTTDKGGRPYFEHCHFVAEAGLDDEEKAAGYLHDVEEDTDITSADLRESGMSERVIHIVETLTKRDSETYKEYIKRVASDPDPGCVRLKKRDLEHNTMVSRLKNLSKKNLDKLEDYFWAYTYLKTIK